MDSPTQIETKPVDDAATMPLDVQKIKNAYSYSPLLQGHIRLLKLLPDQDKTAPLRCSLIDYPLEDLTGSNHLYDALSYVWGSPEKTQSISVDSFDLPITANLHVALLHLRDRFLERIIWVDAISINQQDTKERSSQVQRMAMIYAMASRVVVWIGESEDNSDQALEEIHKSANGQLTENDGETRKAVLKLLLRPWFRRIWVLQEVAAARNVVILCGSTEIDGYVFCIGVNALKLTYEGNPGLRNLIRTATYLIRRTVFRPKKATSESSMFSLNIGPLSELIDLYHGREASDPRDKIYALLGMSSNSYNLTPDYNITWQKLFEGVIRHIICKQVSVTTWHDREVAVIKSKGCALGHISSVESDTTWDYKQHVIISNKEQVYRHYKDYLEIRWTLQTPAKSIQHGDIFCLLQGASQPMIIRQWRDYFIIVAIAVNPTNDIQAGTSDSSWKQTLQLATITPRDFLLVWDWTRFLTENEQNNMNLIKSQIPRDGKTLPLIESELMLGDLKINETAVENVEKAIENYKIKIGDEHSYMENLSAIFMNSGHYEEAKKFEVMMNILNRRGNYSHLTEESIIHLIKSFDKEAMQFLLDRRSDEVAITHGIIKAAAKSEKKGMMKLLLDRRGDQIIITEDIVEAAAGNILFGKEILELLLNQRGDQVIITEGIVKAAAKHWNGKEMIELLLDRRGDQITITEDIVKAAIKHDRLGRALLKFLLNRRGDQITITEGILILAAENQINKETMELLLNQREDQIIITEDVIKAAAEGWKNKEVMELLLDRQGDKITITEDIVKAAIQSWYGKEVMEFFLDRRGDQVIITEEIIKFAAEYIKKYG